MTNIHLIVILFVIMICIVLLSRTLSTSMMVASICANFLLIFISLTKISKKEFEMAEKDIVSAPLDTIDDSADLSDPPPVAPIVEKFVINSGMDKIGNYSPPQIAVKKAGADDEKPDHDYPAPWQTRVETARHAVSSFDVVGDSKEDYNSTAIAYEIKRQQHAKHALDGNGLRTTRQFRHEFEPEIRLSEANDWWGRLEN